MEKITIEGKLEIDNYLGKAIYIERKSFESLYWDNLVDIVPNNFNKKMVKITIEEIE